MFSHAQRHKLICAGTDQNPFRSPKFAGVRCVSLSDYEVKVVTPDQMIAILKALDKPETKLEWTLTLVHAATALRPGECFALKWMWIMLTIKYSFDSGAPTIKESSY